MPITPSSIWWATIDGTIQQVEVAEVRGDGWLTVYTPVPPSDKPDVVHEDFSPDLLYSTREAAEAECQKAIEEAEREAAEAKEE